MIIIILIFFPRNQIEIKLSHGSITCLTMFIRRYINICEKNIGDNYKIYILIIIIIDRILVSV